MNAVSARTLDFFDRHVVQHIVEKYGFDELQAIKAGKYKGKYKIKKLGLRPAMSLYHSEPFIIDNDGRTITRSPGKTQPE